MDVDSSTIPAGTTGSCTCFTEFSGHFKGYYGCKDAALEYGVTIANLKSWNTWLGSDCDASLFTNLTANSYRAMCVGIGGTVTPTSSSASRTSTSASTSITSSSSSVPSPSGSVCNRGTGEGNHLGLCDYSCCFGYCPSPVCTCLSYGAQVPPPAATWPPGYPAPGMDDSYLGLCSFACNHGYCPEGACTHTNP